MDGCYAYGQLCLSMTTVLDYVCWLSCFVVSVVTQSITNVL